MSVTQTRGCGTPPCGCTAPCVALFSFYEDEFDRATLLAQLQLFRTNFPVEQKKTIHDIVSVMQGMSVGERAMLSEVVKLVRLLLVMPAANAVSERSFSAMWRIKTYLRSTMFICGTICSSKFRGVLRGTRTTCTTVPRQFTIAYSVLNPTIT